MFLFIMSVESNLKMPNSQFDSEEDIVEVSYWHFISNPLFLLGDYKPLGGIASYGSSGLFKDLMEFMNNKSNEISLGASVLLLSNLVKLALTF